MQFIDHDREYALNRVAGPIGANMTLELIAVREQRTIAKIVYSEAGRDFTISVFEQHLPLSVIERLISSASFALLPSTMVHEL